MSSERPVLTASRREVTGKAVARLRRAGQLPAVAYGHREPSTNLAIDAHDFEQLRRHVGPNTLIDLAIDGKKPKPALVHGVQIHPITRRPLHVDFLLVTMTEELTVDVPLVPVGESPAVELHGGTLLQLVDTIKVRARADHLPQEIAVRVDRLVDFETVLHVRDLDVPAGVTVLTDPDEVVAKVAPPRVEAVPEAAPEAAPEAPPEAPAEAAGRGTEAGATD
jgi:large subunit ribosomal protein L25